MPYAQWRYYLRGASTSCPYTQWRYYRNGGLGWDRVPHTLRFFRCAGTGSRGAVFASVLHPSSKCNVLVPCRCHFTISLSLAQLGSRAPRPPWPRKFEFRYHPRCLKGVRCNLWGHCVGAPAHFTKKLSVKMPAEAVVNVATKALAIAACTSSCHCSCFQSMLRNGHSPFASARCCECVLASALCAS